jgi:hypothetical protein
VICEQLRFAISRIIVMLLQSCRTGINTKMVPPKRRRPKQCSRPPESSGHCHSVRQQRQRRHSHENINGAQAIQFYVRLFLRLEFEHRCRRFRPKHHPAHPSQSISSTRSSPFALPQQPQPCIVAEPAPTLPSTLDQPVPPDLLTMLRPDSHCHRPIFHTRLIQCPQRAHTALLLHLIVCRASQRTSYIRRRCRTRLPSPKETRINASAVR